MVSEPLVDRVFRPMRAVAGTLPTDPGWTYELKWDGMRAIATCSGGRLRLRSSNLLDITEGFPELAPLTESLPPLDLVLDGELVAFTEDAKPSFGRLQQRIHRRGARAARLAASVPVMYVVFDVLHLDGHDVMALPYVDRRRLLDALVEPGPAWRVAEAYDDGEELLAIVVTKGLEGVMAKRTDSAYEEGRRSSAWRKVKVRQHQEFVVGAWLPGEGHRHQLGSLAVGLFEGNELHYVGRVGSGLTDPEIRRLRGRLDPLARATCPFAGHPVAKDRELRKAFWVEPELVVEVAFAERTAEGLLRHPVYLGERTDRDAADVSDDVSDA